MKRWLVFVLCVAICMPVLPSTAQAQTQKYLLFADDFESYAAGDVISTASGWTQHCEK